MPAAEAIRSLRQMLGENTAVNVLIGSEPRQQLVIQRLNLRQELAAEFLSVAREAIPGDDSLLRPYDPGYTPGAEEMCYLELLQRPQIEDVITSLSQVQQAELFRERDEIVDHLRFYAIILSPTARRHAVFLRTYSPMKELSRKAGFAALYSRGHYDKIESKIFLFDRKMDCFSWDGYLFIDSIPAFQRIFKYYEELRARADETVTAILAQIPISNAEAFRAAGVGQLQMMAKLGQIARKPYLAQVTMDDIRRTIQEFNLDVQIVQENGQERILFETAPRKRWIILKMLDDDYLGSVMTNQKYEVNSKSALVR